MKELKSVKIAVRGGKPKTYILKVDGQEIGTITLHQVTTLIENGARCCFIAATDYKEVNQR